MTTEPKMTPWFVNGEKPARPGAYNVSCRKSDQSGKFFGYWDGKKWCWGLFPTPDEAATDHYDGESASVASGSWRGLAECPA